MTMRDNVEIVKESAEKSKLIDELQTDLALADMLLGSLIRSASNLGLEILLAKPIDNDAP